MAVDFVPVKAGDWHSVEEYERRRDVTTREQLKLLKQQLDKQRQEKAAAAKRSPQSPAPRAQTIAVAWIVGVLLISLCLSTCLLPALFQTHKAAPFANDPAVSAPLQTLASSESPDFVHTHVREQLRQAEGSDAPSQLDDISGFVSTTVPEKTVVLSDDAVSSTAPLHSGHHAQFDNAGMMDSQPKEVRTKESHTSSCSNQLGITSIPDAVQPSAQLQQIDHSALLKELPSVVLNLSDMNSSQIATLGVSDVPIDPQQHHAEPSQPHRHSEAVMSELTGASDNRPDIPQRNDLHVTPEHHTSQARQSMETDAGSSYASSPEQVQSQQQQLDMLIALYKQGRLTLPAELNTVGDLSSFAKASLMKISSGVAHIARQSHDALDYTVSAVVVYWRTSAQHVDAATPHSWVKYTLAGVILMLALLLLCGTIKCLSKLVHKCWSRLVQTNRQPQGVKLTSDVVSPTDKHKHPVQLHADASMAGVSAASPGKLHLGSSERASPASVDSSAPGTPVSHSASPALKGLQKSPSQLSSEPSSPTLTSLQDCQTPAGQVKATGMMTTPADAKLVGAAAPPPPPPPPRGSVSRANSVPAPPPPPPPMPGSGLKRTPVPPPPPPPPGSSKCVKTLAGRPTPPPPQKGPLSSVKAQNVQAGGAVQSPHDDLPSTGQHMAPAVEMPSRARQHWQKLKKLHWDQVHGARKGVWLVVNSEAAKINFDRLATRFKVVARSVKPADAPKSSVVALLDRTRAMNLAIPLTKLDMKPAEIKAALMTIDGGDLTLENLEALLKMVPTDDEAKSVQLFLQGKHHNHLGMCDVSKLDPAGQYCAEVVGIPNLAQRISSFIFVRHFGDSLQRVTRHLDILGKACQELRSSRQLSDLLAHVLAVGNFLNESSGSVSAIGFKLATLLKLTFLRDDNNRSLLHFVVDEMTEAGLISDKLIHQLASTPPAADIQMAGLSKVLAEQTGGLRLVNKVLLQPALAAGGTPAGDEGLLQDLQAFHQKAAATLSAAQAQYESVSRALEELSLFFMEVHDVAQPEQLVKTMKDFITLFKKTLVEVQAARELAKAKELRQQRRAAGQPHRSASLPAASLNLGQKAAQARASRLLHRGASQLEAIKHIKPP